MITFENLTDDTGTLAVLLIGSESHLAHRIENAPLHGFETVANIGKRARCDDAHRIRKIGLAHLDLDVNRGNAIGWNIVHLFFEGDLFRRPFFFGESVARGERLTGEGR